jgi:hypothetical protein
MYADEPANRAEENSTSQCHRALIDLRGTEDVLVYGSYDPLVQDGTFGNVDRDSA